MLDQGKNYCRVQSIEMKKNMHESQHVLQVSILLNNLKRKSLQLMIRCSEVHKREKKNDTCTDRKQIDNNIR